MNILRWLFGRALGAVLAMAVLMFGGAREVCATALTWDAVSGDGATITDGGGTWNTGGGFWNNGSGDATWTAGDTATFGVGGTAGTVTIAGGVSDAGGITFNSVSAGSYLITASTLTLTGTANINVAGSTTAQIDSVVAGAVTLYKIGSGTLVLNGANTMAANPSFSVNGGGTLKITSQQTGFNTGSLLVGDTSANNTLEISGSGRFAGNFPGLGPVVGVGSGASAFGGNTAIFSTPGTAAAATLNQTTGNTGLNLGMASSNNTVVVTNGAFVRFTGAVTVGNSIDSVSNVLRVVGAGSTITANSNNGTGFYCGNNGIGNRIYFENGATGIVRKIFVATTSGTNNVVTVSGSNARIDITGTQGAIKIGGAVNGCISNSIVVTNGASIVCLSASTRGMYVGGFNNCTGNYLQVAGPGSLLNISNAQSFVIGGNNDSLATPADSSAVSNHLDVFDGGTYTNFRGMVVIGVDSAFNLGDGGRVSTGYVGLAALDATNVWLKNASARLNVNKGWLQGRASGPLVWGPGQVNINGDATFNPISGGNSIDCAIAGSGTLFKPGSDMLTISNAAAFTGNFQSSAGTLKILGDTSASLGNINVESGAALSLDDGTNRTHAVVGLNATNATFYFNWTNGVDRIQASGPASVSGTITFDFGSANTPAPGTYTLLSAASGLSSATYALSLPPSGATLDPVTDTAISITLSGGGPPPFTTAYWRGNVDVAAPSSMSGTNWSPTAAGPYTDDSRVPGSGCDVFFSADTAFNQSGIDLGANLTFQSLTFNDPVPVTITNATKTLTVNGTIAANQSASMYVPVTLGGSSPTALTTAPGTTMTLGNLISGNAFALSGGGTLSLKGTNTLATAPAINQGTLSLDNSGKLTVASLGIGDTVSVSNVTVAVNGSGSQLAISANSTYKIGNKGAGNALVVTTNGVVATTVPSPSYTASYVGYESTSSNNAVTIDGSGASWSKMLDFVVGETGSYNTVTVKNGGVLSSVRGIVGNAPGANSNSITITGSGSSWTTFESHSAIARPIDAGKANTTNNAINLYNGGALTVDEFRMGGTNSTLRIGDGNAISTVNLVMSGASGSPGIKMDSPSASVVINSGRISPSNGGSLIWSSSANASVVTLDGWAYLSSAGASCSVDKTMTGTGGVIKEGTGTLTLNAANTYNGDTVVSNGTLAVGHTNALVNSTLDTQASSGSRQVTLTAAGSEFNIGGLKGVDDLALGAKTISVGANGQTTTFGGILSGSGGLTKVGAGILTLSAANTHTGTNLVSGGTLELNNLNALQNSTLDTGAAGAQSVTLTPAGTYNIGALQGSDDLAIGANTISVGSSGASTTFGGALSGVGGGLTKVGSGTLTLSAVNTYSGNTIINDGTLRLDIGSTINNSPLIQLMSGTAVLRTLPGTCEIVSGQELKGVGSVMGSTTMDSGSTLTPGNSVGTLTFSDSLTLTAGMTGNFELGTNTTAGVDYDNVVVGGTLQVDNVTWNDFNFTTNASFGAGVYTLVDGAALGGGSAVGAPASGSIGTYSGALSISGNDLILTVTEPVMSLSPETVIKFQ